MKTFYLFTYSTGILNGKTIEAENRKEAEAIALNKGINIYDDYGLTLDNGNDIPLTEKQVFFNQEMNY